MTIVQKKDLANKVIERLEEQYPDAICSLEYAQPHELLIATRLSAQCTDARVNIVTKELFAKFHSINEFADADIAEIEEIVKPCGLYKTKAKSIKEMCIQL
ncbi:MAG: endonuclease III, partial [Ruminococcus sp.]|nr:endonuclease III [Ruminococcus sp.]